MKKNINQRMCVCCRVVQNKNEMLRIVRKPDGKFDIDIDRREQGRGAYLCKNRECLSKAVKKHLFDKSFKTKVDSGVYVKLEKILTKEGDESTFE